MAINNAVAIDDSVAPGRDSAETICLDVLGVCDVAVDEQESQQAALAFTAFFAVTRVGFDVFGNCRRICDLVYDGTSLFAASRQCGAIAQGRRACSFTRYDGSDCLSHAPIVVAAFYA